MHLNYKTPVEGKKYYIIRGFRDKNGKSTSENYKNLGTLAEIREREGVTDAWAWIESELDRCNEEEREGRRKVKIDLCPNRRIKE